MYNRFIFLESQNVLGELKIEKDRCLLEIEFLQSQINKDKFFIQDETLDNDEKIKIENRSSAFVYERDHMTEEKKQRYLLDIANKEEQIASIKVRLDQIEADIKAANDRINEYRKQDAEDKEHKDEPIVPVVPEPANNDNNDKKDEPGLNPINPDADKDLNPEDGLNPINPENDADLNNDDPVLGPVIEPDAEDLEHADDDKLDEEEVTAIKPAKEPLLRKWPKIIGAAVAFITAFLAARYQQAGSLFNLDKDEIVTETDQEQKDEEQDQGQKDQEQGQKDQEQGQPGQQQQEEQQEQKQEEEQQQEEKEEEKEEEEVVIQQSKEGYPVYLEQGEAFVDEEAGVEITASGNTYDITGDEVTFDHHEDLEQAGKFSVVESENVKLADPEVQKTGDEMTYDEAVESMDAEDLQNYNQGFSDLDWGQLFSDNFGEDELSK